MNLLSWILSSKCIQVFYYKYIFVNGIGFIFDFICYFSMKISANTTLTRFNKCNISECVRHFVGAHIGPFCHWYFEQPMGRCGGSLNDNEHEYNMFRDTKIRAIFFNLYQYHC